MKFKFMKATILTLVICISSVAQAGLIIGNQEFLDLGLTSSKTNAEIEAMILNDSALTGYTLATDIDAAMLINLLPDANHSDEGWHAINNLTLTPDAQAIFNFFTGGYTYGYGATGGIFLDAHGTTVRYDAQSQGYLRYRDADGDASGVINGNVTGIFDILHDETGVTALYNRGYGPNDIRNTSTTAGDRSINTSVYSHSLYTRSVSANTPPAISVSTPSSIAIFALGLIGLASRRFKK